MQGVQQGGVGMEGTRIAFAVECTMNLSLHWRVFRDKYIEPVLRAVDKGHLGPCEVAVVAFRTRDPFGDGPPAESSGWLRSVADVRAVLDGLQFIGGGSNEAVALPDGLLEVAALAQQPSSLPAPMPAGGLFPSTSWRPVCHCMLLAVSDAVRLRTLSTWGEEAVTPQALATSQQGARYAALMDGGSGVVAHDVYSIVHALKSSNITLSVISSKTARTLLVLYVTAAMGLGAVDGANTQSEQQKLLQNNNRLLHRNHIAMIAPSWVGAHNVLIREREVLVNEHRARMPQDRTAMAATTAATLATSSAAVARPGATAPPVVPAPGAGGAGQKPPPMPPAPGSMDASAQQLAAQRGQSGGVGMVPMSMMGMTPPSMTLGHTPSGLPSPMEPHWLQQSQGVGTQTPAVPQPPQQQQQQQQAMQQGVGMYGQPQGVPQQQGGQYNQGNVYGGGAGYGMAQQMAPQQQGRQYSAPQPPPAVSAPQPAGWPQPPQPPQPPPPQQQAIPMGMPPAAQSLQAQQRMQVWKGRLLLMPTLPGLSAMTQMLIVGDVAVESQNTGILPYAKNWEHDLVLRSTMETVALKNLLAMNGRTNRTMPANMVKCSMRLLTCPMLANPNHLQSYQQLTDKLGGSMMAMGDVGSPKLKFVVQLPKYAPGAAPGNAVLAVGGTFTGLLLLSS